MAVPYRILRQPLTAGARLVGLFTRDPSTPWLPVAVYGPLAGAAVLWNVLDGQLPWWAVVALPPAGFLLWTLLEYFFHSVGFHKPTQSPRLQAWQSSHASHHDAPADPGRIVARFTRTGPFALLFFGVLALVLGPRAGALVMAGLIVGYLAYELIHFYIHVGRWPRRFMRPLIRHHLYHHYKDQGRCFGVTSPLWDWVFRTNRPPKRRRGAPAAPKNAERTT